MSCVFGESSSALVIGFRNGLIEMRDYMSGELICKHMLTQQLSCLIRSSFVGYDKDQILAIQRNGDVYGYDVLWEKRESGNATTQKREVVHKIKETQERKNELTAELNLIQTRKQVILKIIWLK